MTNVITSNWRRFSRTFYPFLLAIAVVWAMPRNAQAQLYIANKPDKDPLGRVSEYDPATGAAINATLITITATYEGNKLALEGDTLFVASGDTVGKYDVTTGAAINPSFITGLDNPFGGVAVLGNTLFVPKFKFKGTVGKYNAITGDVINPNFITGIDGGTSLAVLGDTLFVANGYGGKVGKYDANTGDAINRDFIPNVRTPVALAVSGNTLFVASESTKSVGKYDATTGAAISRNFITGLRLYPWAIAVLGDILFVTSRGDRSDDESAVGKYNATTGDAINPNFITGLDEVRGIAVKSAK